jgi:hypothetical protein
LIRLFNKLLYAISISARELCTRIFIALAYFWDTWHYTEYRQLALLGQLQCLSYRLLKCRLILDHVIGRQY